MAELEAGLADGGSIDEGCNLEHVVQQDGVEPAMRLLEDGDWGVEGVGKRETNMFSSNCLREDRKMYFSMFLSFDLSWRRARL